MNAARKIIRVFLLALALSAVGPGPAGVAGEEVSEYGNPFTWVTVGQVAVKAEVVRTPEKMFLGLSYRKELPEGRGMLFVMPGLAVQNFVMRGMEFPLDILWVVPGKIVGLEKNVPPQYEGTLTSSAAVSHVLEVPGGFCDRYGIKTGDPVTWE
jgi:hypothetical protein